MGTHISEFALVKEPIYFGISLCIHHPSSPHPLSEKKFKKKKKKKKNTCKFPLKQILVLEYFKCQIMLYLNIIVC